jgi:hypothetical protein
MASKVDIEPNAHHLESVDMAEKDTNTPRDYAGAVLTRTLAETKLVKKLDYRIMACLHNEMATTRQLTLPANLVAYVLVELPRP